MNRARSFDFNAASAAAKAGLDTLWAKPKRSHTILLFVGACSQSQLVLRNCSFDGTDKTNVHKESGAVVQTDMVAEASPAPEATTEPKTERSSVRRRSTPSPDSRRRAEEINRILRQFRP